MSAPAAFTAAVCAVVALTAVLPWLGMKMLAPSLEVSPLAQRENFRGRTVFVGLGVAWVFWVAGMVVLRVAGQVAPRALSLFTQIGAISPLVITALLFGLLDDAYGTGEDRGFRGHLRALGTGRLTTGAFKLLGVGLVSLAAAASVNSAITGAPGALPALTGSLALYVGWTVVLGAVIALSANLVNLADLRPGRALKSYLLYAALLVVGAAASYSVGDASLMALALAGPLVAIWRLDLGERGMLGDAGANAAGAALGFLAAWECGRTWPALVVLALLLGLNLASERWSFSRVIAGNGVLSWLDGLGRQREDPPAKPKSAKRSPQSETPDG